MTCTYCHRPAVLSVRILPSWRGALFLGDRERVVPCCSAHAVRFHGREVSHGRVEACREPDDFVPVLCNGHEELSDGLVVRCSEPASHENGACDWHAEWANRFEVRKVDGVRS